MLLNRGHNALGTSSGGGGTTAQAAHFDGSATLSTNNLACVDSSTLSFAAWLRFAPDGNPYFVPWIVDPDNYSTFTTIDLSGAEPTASFYVSDNSSTSAGSGPIGVSQDQWFWFAGMADQSAAPGVLRLWVNDTELSFTVSFDNAPFDITCNGVPFAVGSDTFGGNCAFDMADLWVAPGQFVDFSVAENRRKFIDESGRPVDLGSDGSAPTGTAPAIFFSGDASSFGTNRGTGGDFTLTGTLTSASSDPSTGVVGGGGVSTPSARITESGDTRITESGERRILEAA